jgi:CubicO group peptidase (beta-lactamase class C family)
MILPIRIKYLSCALAFLLGPAVLSPQVAEITVPKTPAGVHLAEYLKLCNAPSEAALTKFAAEHYAESVLKRQPAEEFGRGETAFCEQAGGLELHHADQAGADEVDGLVQSRTTEEWILLVLKVAAEEPHKVTSFRFMHGEAPESAVPRGMSDAQISADLKKYMDRLAGSDRFSGVVLLAKDGKPIFQHAYGLADKLSQRKTTMDSIYTIGSMGKMFTAAAVAQLVDQRKISFDDPVGKFLPDYPNQDVREKVTISELLTHTSGLADFLGRRTPEMKKSGVKRAAEYVTLFQNDPLRFEPGKGWGYSNAGFALLGAIIEKVSGQSYFDYIREQIFKPAGMSSSDTNETRRVPPRMVTPYRQRNGGKWNEREPSERDIGNPAGGSSSTAPDLLRFAQALQGNKLVSRKAFEELISPHSKTPWGADYGYGFEIRNVNGHHAAGHGGGFPGVSTKLEMYLDQGYTVVVLSNYEQIAEAVAGKVRPMIFGK